MVIYLTRILRRDALSDIAEEFGLKGYSSVSSVIRRVENRLQRDRRLKGRYEDILCSITKGQT